MENNKWGLQGKLAEKAEKEGIGFLYTNHDMAKHLISTINFRDDDIVMNSSYGDGAFYDHLPEHLTKHYCEINEDIDYLKDNTIVDITLDNPPFVPRKLFWEFMRVAMENTKREIYWLINMNCINVFTPKRLDEMKEKGWYLNSFHIVSDKRWYGRYIWCKITKVDNGTSTWKRKSF